MKIVACQCEKCGESMTATRLGRKQVTAADLKRIKGLAAFHMRTRHGLSAAEARDFVELMTFYIPPER